MPLLGTHVSTSGGVSQAPARGLAVGVHAIQLFAKNNNQWLGKIPDATEVEKFKAERKRCEIQVAFSHAGYLINLASPDEKNHSQSLKSMQMELELAEIYGLDFIVLHPGAHVGSGEAVGTAKIIQSLNHLFEKTAPSKVPILLETTAGQGSAIGYKFEQLAALIDGVKDKKRIGICLDSCHVFAAGYDLRTAKDYAATWKEFDRTIGLKKLRAIHLNDSKKDLGSRVDRHDHIGAGCLGVEAFRHFMNDPKLQELPMVLETPKDDPIQDDLKNLKLLRSLVK